MVDQEMQDLIDIKESLYKVFVQYTSQEHGYLEPARFRKFLLACSILPEYLAINELDILYMTAKARYRESQVACGLTFEAFAHALLLIA